MAEARARVSCIHRCSRRRCSRSCNRRRCRTRSRTGTRSARCPWSPRSPPSARSRDRSSRNCTSRVLEFDRPWSSRSPPCCRCRVPVDLPARVPGTPAARPHGRRCSRAKVKPATALASAWVIEKGPQLGMTWHTEVELQREGSNVFARSRSRRTSSRRALRSAIRRSSPAAWPSSSSTKCWHAARCGHRSR